MKKIFPNVVENTLIADNIFKLVLEDNFPHDEFKPGKFLHVKCSKGLDPLLRRPMSICDISDDERYLTVLYRREGRGTTLLSEYRAGEKIDILAPLGNNFELPAGYNGDKNAAGDLQQQCLSKKILLIGGGIGVPPLYYLGRKLKAAGHSIISILGFNAAKDVFYENEFKSLGEVFITTVDGSYGMKGFVIDALAEIESAEIVDCEPSYDVMYSCGPKAMLKALQSRISSDKLAYMSLEERMGCGVGACLACVCNYNEGFERDKSYSRVCTEGPVYKLHEISL
ncbi:MAG: dihydroorotate dehydrogenase electron transfer subunit [Cyanobacteria bacterium REEB446]|nr:dihydroorotate dehydrogenase electron transfer subunit [Cyanobacteria bacterium REEB446]